jgi:signal transduction histidine kinase/putative methionine-R-sulfoxide reductase with GAF domain
VREGRQRESWSTQSQEIQGLREQLDLEHSKLLALQDIGAASGTILDIDELLTLIANRITRVMEADRTTIYILDDDGKHLVSRVAEGAARYEFRLDVGSGLAGQCVKTGQVINIEDVYRDPRFDPAWDIKTGYRSRTMLCAPMRNRTGGRLGVVQCLNKRNDVFNVEDEAMLSALASQAAVAIENGKFFVATVQKNMELLQTKQQLEKKVQELDVLMEIARVSASAQRLDDLLEGVLTRAVAAIEVEAGSILIADGDGDLRFRCAVGGAPEKVKGVRIPLGAGICGWVAVNRAPRFVNDVRGKGEEGATSHLADIADRVGYHPRSVLAVPLFWEGGVGALELLNKHKGKTPFGDDDVRFATLIASHISSAISIATARERRDQEERLSTIGQLLSSVLHDLKTPMAVIAGYTRELVEADERELRERFSKSVLRQVELINAMTRETIAFARGDRSLWVRKVYLKQFFEELADQLQHELSGKGIKIELELEDKGVARFDQHKIQRAVHNLARNAAEAIGPPHARKRGEKFVIGVSRQSDGAIVLTFRDDGPGIPDAIRHKLFDSFTTHGKEGGTGLGLAIVKKVAEDHGGTIAVESKPGETIFRMVLPQTEDSGVTEVERSAS